MKKKENTSNSPRGTRIHIYKFFVFGPPRPNHNKPHEMNKNMNEHQEGTTHKYRKHINITPRHHHTHL